MLANSFIFKVFPNIVNNEHSMKKYIKKKQACKKSNGYLISEIQGRIQCFYWLKSSWNCLGEGYLTFDKLKWDCWINLCRYLQRLNFIFYSKLIKYLSFLTLLILDQKSSGSRPDGTTRKSIICNYIFGDNFLARFLMIFWYFVQI